MLADASSDQIEQVGASLRADPNVVAVTYLNHDDAASEFSSLLGDPAHGGPIIPGNLPTSYHVALRPGTDRDAERLRYKADPGVYEVTAP